MTYVPERDVQDILVLAADCIVSPMLFGDCDRFTARAVTANLVLWSYEMRDSNQYVTVIGRTSHEDIVHSSHMLGEYANQIVHLVRHGVCALSLRPVVLTDRIHLLAQTVALYLTLAQSFRLSTSRGYHQGHVHRHVLAEIPLVGIRLARVLRDIGRPEGCVARGELTLEQYTKLCELLVPARDWELADNRIRRARWLEEIQNSSIHQGT